MSRLRTDTAFGVTTLVLGACVVVGPRIAVLIDVPRDQLGDEIGAAVLGMPLLVSPYVGLALLGRSSRNAVRYGALALILVASFIFYLSAASDAQGALVVIYTLPCQWGLAIAVAHARFRQRRT